MASMMSDRDKSATSFRGVSACCAVSLRTAESHQEDQTTGGVIFLGQPVRLCSRSCLVVGRRQKSKSHAEEAFGYQKLMTLIPDLRGRLAESTLEGHPWKATLSVIMSGHEDRSFSLYAGAFCVGNAYIPILMSSHGGAFCVGNAHSQTSCRVREERSAWEIPIYKPQVAFCVGNPYLQTQLAAWRSVSCGKFYLQTQLERFVWEISIYKLN